MTLSFIFYFCYYILTSHASKVFALFISVESVWLFCHMHTKTLALAGNKVNWVRSLFCFFLQIRTLLTEIDYTLVSRHGCRLASASHSPPPLLSFIFLFIFKTLYLISFPIIDISPRRHCSPVGWPRLSKGLVILVDIAHRSQVKNPRKPAAFLLLFECKGKTISRGS